jgi:hypothetical protein
VVAEDREGFLELGKVLGAEDDGDRASVARDRDALVLVLDAVDDVAEVIADVAEGFNGHDHNCGASTVLPQASLICCRVRAPKLCRAGSAFLGSQVPHAGPLRHGLCLDRPTAYGH